MSSKGTAMAECCGLCAEAADTVGLPDEVRLRVGQLNVLSPTYAVKWREREGCVDRTAPDGQRVSNWPRRWPALRRVLECAEWDVVFFQVASSRSACARASSLPSLV